MLQNLHTHSLFCDGNDTPEEIVAAALSRGFDSLGFSSHAPTEIKDDCELTDVSGYVDCIKELKARYSGKIKLFLGIELDYYSKEPKDLSDFDYSISSAHYSILKNGVSVAYDHSAERTKKHINEDFCGDGLAYARSYFETVAKLEPKTDVSFVGHIDAVSKFSERHPEFFDTDSPRYRAYVFVISLKLTLSVLFSGIPRATARCQEIASPSRSGSVARNTLFADFASFFMSLIRSPLPLMFI